MAETAARQSDIAHFPKNFWTEILTPSCAVPSAYTPPKVNMPAVARSLIWGHDIVPQPLAIFPGFGAGLIHALHTSNTTGFGSVFRLLDHQMVLNGIRDLKNAKMVPAGVPDTAGTRWKKIEDYLPRRAPSPIAVPFASVPILDAPVHAPDAGARPKLEVKLEMKPALEVRGAENVPPLRKPDPKADGAKPKKETISRGLGNVRSPLSIKAETPDNKIALLVPAKPAAPSSVADTFVKNSSTLRIRPSDPDEVEVENDSELEYDIHFDRALPYPASPIRKEQASLFTDEEEEDNEEEHISTMMHALKGQQPTRGYTRTYKHPSPHTKHVSRNALAAQ
ncbi:hypothetical protein CPB85DRAFT_461223 [Mucidula mucida]|nr:hypothetical protein CPB85DRAFT_461223 [Mucidula mucida]